MKYTEKAVVKAIRTQFTDANAKLLRSPWPTKRKNSGIEETGFCQLASFAYFQLMGGKAAGLCIKKWSNPDDTNDGHFWVENASGERIDLTSKQYGDNFKHYAECENARIRLTPKISKFISAVETALP